MENEMTVPLREIAEELHGALCVDECPTGEMCSNYKIIMSNCRKAFDLGKQAGREEAVGQQQTQEGQELSERIRALSEKPKEG